MNDEDRKIIAQYNKMPWQDGPPINDNGIEFLIPFLVISLILGMGLLFGAHIDNAKNDLAQQIYDIEVGVYTCEQLERQLPRSVHYLLERTIEKQLIKQKCMTQSELNDKNDVDYCLKHDTVTCRVAAMKNPEKYAPREPFNTRGR